MIQILPSIPAEEFLPLYNMLNQIRLRKTSYRNNRRGFPHHEKMTLGIVRGRFSGIVGLSNDSIIHTEIFEEVMRIGDKYCPFEYTSIHLNHNVVCPPHVDDKNNGISMLVSFGEYEGGNIVIAGAVYNAKHTPIVFDGSKLTHWNTDNLVGNKYSLVYYKKNKW